MRSLTLAVFLLEAQAGADTAGRIAFFDGDVQVSGKMYGANRKPVLGHDIAEADMVTTGEPGRIKLIMDDDSELNILSGSKLEIAEYKSAEGKRTVTLRLAEGRMRAVVQPGYGSAGDQFKIETPVAVMTVHGTDFFAEYQPATHLARVTTFTGSVNLETKGKPVEVKTGQAAQFSRGQKSATVKDVDHDSIAALDRESKMDPAHPEDHPAKRDRPAAAHKRRHVQTPQ